jgi:DNA-directed RNA polymerase specialized sigma24 family protein
MHYLEGRTFEEIAQALERPVGTIKSSIFRANVRIYRKLTSQQLVNAAA